MDANDHGPSGVSDRPVTFEAAEALGGFELARQWADRTAWAWPGKETARDHLAELAYMSALAAWLRRWQPIQIHRALLAGVRPEEVATALGSSVDSSNAYPTTKRAPSARSISKGVTQLIPSP